MNRRAVRICPRATKSERSSHRDLPQPNHGRTAAKSPPALFSF